MSFECDVKVSFKSHNVKLFIATLFAESVCVLEFGMIFPVAAESVFRTMQHSHRDAKDLRFSRPCAARVELAFAGTQKDMASYPLWQVQLGKF